MSQSASNAKMFVPPVPGYTSKNVSAHGETFQILVPSGEITVEKLKQYRLTNGPNVLNVRATSKAAAFIAAGMKIGSGPAIHWVITEVHVEVGTTVAAV